MEYLWAPGCFVQLSGPLELELSEGRVVTIVSVRLNANTKALTVEVSGPFTTLSEWTQWSQWTLLLK